MERPFLFFTPKGAQNMPIELLRTLIIEQIEKTNDTGLLDLIYKLLMSEC